ncbi:hypothetical protein [Kitasatospora sp. SC0581]|uniref:hypothetical protein n=1 Tax=Kitasatospora sp. SC0581 TaxID=3394360 RepID=UPI003A8486D6
MATWGVLLVVVVLLPFLPGRWGEHDRQRALALLWWLLVFIGPFVTCALNRRWIHANERKPGGAARRA